MILAIFVAEFLVKGIRIWSFRGEQFQPMRFLKFVAHKKSIVLCLHPLFNVSPI